MLNIIIPPQTITNPIIPDGCIIQLNNKLIKPKSKQIPLYHKNTPLLH